MFSFNSSLTVSESVGTGHRPSYEPRMASVHFLFLPDDDSHDEPSVESFASVRLMKQVLHRRGAPRPRSLYSSAGNVRIHKLFWLFREIAF
jgi:hypothetical protein